MEALDSMGGYGSGRYGGRPTTDSGLTLSLPKLMRDRLLRPDCAWGGSLVWTNLNTGERVGSIGYEAHLGQDAGRMRLKYTTTRYGGEKRESDYWIQLETTPQPFGAVGGGSSAPGRAGGRRTSICRTAPSPSRPAKPTASPIALSAKPLTIALCGARSNCAGKLGADGGIGDYVPKPKWMRWPTYDRKLEEVFAAEGVVDAHLSFFVAKLNRRIRR